jgi:hypothetical protein
LTIYLDEAPSASKFLTLFLEKIKIQFWQN